MCKYCEFGEDGEGAIINEDGTATDSFNLGIDDEGRLRIQCFADVSSPINFCPMCGHKLAESNDGD